MRPEIGEPLPAGVRTPSGNGGDDSEGFQGWVGGGGHQDGRAPQGRTSRRVSPFRRGPYPDRADGGLREHRAYHHQADRHLAERSKGDKGELAGQDPHREHDGRWWLGGRLARADETLCGGGSGHDRMQPGLPPRHARAGHGIRLRTRPEHRQEHRPMDQAGGRWETRPDEAHPERNRPSPDSPGRPRGWCRRCVSHKHRSLSHGSRRGDLRAGASCRRQVLLRRLFRPRRETHRSEDDVSDRPDGRGGENRHAHLRHWGHHHVARCCGVHGLGLHNGPALHVGDAVWLLPNRRPAPGASQLHAQEGIRFPQ